MVAKFLDETNPKCHLKSELTYFQTSVDLIQFHLICQMLAKFSGVESERTFLCSVQLLHEAGS